MSDDGQPMRVSGGMGGQQPAKAVWKGELRHDEQPNTLVGYLIDTGGWRIELVGTLNAVGHFYELTGELGEPPEGCRRRLMRGVMDITRAAVRDGQRDARAADTLGESTE